MKNSILKGMFVVISVLVITSNSYSYSLKIKNATDGQLLAKSTFAVCNPLENLVEAGQTVEVTNGICCLYQVSATGKSGSVKGQYAIHDPHSTGAGMSCQDNEVTFQMVGGQLTSVRGLSGQETPKITNLRIENTTNSELAVKLRYHAEDVCSPETKIIKPNSELLIQIGLCCLKALEVRAAGGQLNGKTITIDAGGRCSRTSYTIKADATNSLISEAKDW